MANKRQPDERLFRLVDRWGQCFKEWLRQLEGRSYRYTYGYANDYYVRTIMPLLNEIAATPAETEEGFNAKLRILIEEDICTVLWRACQVRGTECCRDFSAGQAKPMSWNSSPPQRKIRWAN